MAARSHAERRKAEAIDQTSRTPENFGRVSDFDAIGRLVDVTGCLIVDVGCGEGKLAREFALSGARVMGLEPEPVQAQKNREAPEIPGVTLIEAGAERIPLESGAANGVIFSRSLHHLPIAKIPDALTEAHRVLDGENGFLLAIEPVLESPFSRLMKPFHDETTARTAAQGALKRLVPDRFAGEREAFYTISQSFPDFAAFTEAMLAASFNRLQRAAIETPEVERLFETGRDGEGYVFDQLMRMNLFLDREPAVPR